MKVSVSLRKRICTTIHKALSHIQGEQTENGSFLTTAGKATTFYTSLISSIIPNDTAMSIHIKKAAVAFLLKEKSALWSFNYWQKESNDNTITPYPDDLDDTFVALQAISRVSEIDEHCWFSIIELLTANESREGGPYQTWILPACQRSKEWHDIDIVVNSNIAYFLSKNNITLPNVQNFFDHCIVNNKISSKYYHDECVIIYFLSRAYDGKYRDILRNKIIQKQNNDGYWGTPFQTACCITALFYLGEKIEKYTKAINYLLSTQKDGIWATTPLFIESRNKSEIIYSGCSAYTSAVCIEALTLYNETTFTKVSPYTEEENLFIKTVREECKNRFTATSPILKEQIESSINALSIKDPVSEIPLLVFRFVEQLILKVSSKKVTALAVANTLGWIGYSIKDGIMDGQDLIALLPCAVICIREASKLFNSVRTKDILDGIEISIAWEYQNCRVKKENHIITLPVAFPDYGNHEILAQKSFGHALGPIIFSSFTGNNQQTQYIEIFFKQYLIARQLNDDAHDWLNDLKNGYMNSVSVEILKKWQKKDITQQTIDLENEVSALQEIFWESQIDIVSQKILEHTKKAHSVLQKITILKDTTFLQDLIFPLEQSAKRAILERNKTISFLNTLK